MAWDIHPKYLRGLRQPQNWRGIIRHKLRKQINWKRSQQQRVYSRRRYHLVKYSSPSSDVISSSFESSADFFRHHGYAYIPDFFSNDFHQLIRTSWPELHFFRLGSDPSKSYDKGPGWTDVDSERIPGISSDFYRGLEAIASGWFEERVSQFCGDGIDRVNSSLASAWARVGSHLLPHKDEAARYGLNTVINFIIFIDGTSPSLQSGGTSLFSSNLYSDPFLIPASLKNSALVYGTGQQLHHGFPRVGARKFSKRIIAQFAPRDLV